MDLGTIRDAVFAVKGKQKETDADAEAGWTNVGGAGRCVRCVKDKQGSCRINLGAIEKWREDAKAGKKFKRHPADSNCTYCTFKKHPCELPASAAMRAVLVAEKSKTGGSLRVEERSVTPSAASSSKRKKMAVDVELPPRKKAKTMIPGGLKEEEFWDRLLAILSSMNGRMGKMVELGEEILATEKETKKLAHHAAGSAASTSRSLKAMEATFARKFGEESEEEDQAQEVPILDVREADEKTEEEESETTEEKAGAKLTGSKAEGKKAEARVEGQGAEADEESGSDSEDDEEEAEGGKGGEEGV
jgi:hypothetical protein